MSDLTPYTPQGERHTFSEIKEMAIAIAKSSLFGVKTADQALGLMLIAQAEGRHPALAARDYHIIDGRPSLKADTILARFQDVGGTVSWTTYNEKECTATFTHPAGGSLSVSWTIKMAQESNLTGKDVWKKYPRAMLRARVISEGIRTIFPGVLVGMYTPEEVQDFDDKPRQEPTQDAEAEIVPFDKSEAVSKIFTVLPSDDVEVRLIVEKYGIVIPDCAPSEFRAVLDECLVDQITDRDHAVEIYKALRDASNDDLELELDIAIADSPDDLPN